ncbi:hypothetical protein EZ456_01900 [Pedobacter psychrodurus]|uniref:Uncharacterized protein n=1 Tax=Pedobacter psychrodurus TaxID=2530456 RepID=A0A4V2MRB6_9SPHI|nr:hypothetical protein [Pedobacter psychrodurus]TCD28938.1 hypothetical protein EZ456_01900 [Pedobacter psychrodurus]
MKNKYSLSSNLILITFLIGIVNLFFYDYKSTQELVIFISILIARYLLFILIKRRFEWSKYLLVLIIVRSVYRLVVVMGNVDIHPVTKINLSLQAIISILAFAILFIVPKLKGRINERRRYLSATRVSSAQH